MRAHLSDDKRYADEAYGFVLASLQYVQEKLGRSKEPEIEHRHVSARELLEGMREYASQQFGRLAAAVLNSWGVRSTSDVGEIVYNMIHSRHMSQTDSDTREDFNNVYDFDEVFCRRFHIATDSVET